MSRYTKPGRRSTRHDSSVTSDDAFVATTLEATNWATKHQGMLLAGIAVVVVLGIGAVYVRGVRATEAQEAAGQLETLHRRLEAGDLAGVRGDLEVFLQNFDGSPFADEARMTLGQVTADLGDADAAVAILEPAARDIGSPLGAQAAGLLAAVYEEAGNLEAAEGLYLRLADRAEMSFQVRDALADAARLRRQQGDYAGAVELYDRILDDMDEDDFARDGVEMRRAEAAAAT